MISGKMTKRITGKDIKENERLVIRKKYQENETLFVTQNVNVHKEKHDSIINFNTNMSNISDETERSRITSKHFKKQRRTKEKSTNKSVREIIVESALLREKITPKCNRITCQHYLHEWEKKKDMKMNKVIYEDINSEEDFSFLVNEKLDTLIRRTKERDRREMETLMARKDISAETKMKEETNIKTKMNYGNPS